MNLFSDHRDINDLTLAKRLFEESRDAFIMLFDNSPVCMSMTAVSPDKRTYFRVNRKFVEIFGFSEAEIIGRTSVEVGILDAEESARVGSIIKEKGCLQNDYVKCISKDGKIVHTQSSIEKMVMDGETYLVSFFINITKITEQQRTIEEQVQQLEIVNRELEAFSYSVSHDLRAPLRAISGYSSILESDFSPVLDGEGIRLLSTVQQNAKKMSDLIDDLLAFSRLGKKELLKTDIDMTLLVKGVITELQALNHNAKINTGILHKIKGDHALIKQVMINLISNGVKYSSKKEDPFIEIRSELRNGEAIYIIKDNGEGFNMKYADKLFGVFQRLHSGAEFEGTGVGLAIVKRIISKHGGTVGAEAEVGKGAVFTFTIPVGG
jgi:PAS domain S-box-containing protein